MIARMLRVPAWNQPQFFGGRKGRIRRWYWYVIRRWETELCQICGRPYITTLWGSSDRLWTEVVALGPSLLCLTCFDNHAEYCGILIKWKPLVLARKDHQGEWDVRLSEDKEEVDALHVEERAYE